MLGIRSSFIFVHTCITPLSHTFHVSKPMDMALHLLTELTFSRCITPSLPPKEGKRTSLFPLGGRIYTHTVYSNCLHDPSPSHRQYLVPVPSRPQQRAGSLYLHAFVTPMPPPGRRWQDMVGTPLTLYARSPLVESQVPETEAFNLLGGEEVGRVGWRWCDTRVVWDRWLELGVCFWTVYCLSFYF